MMLTMLCVLCPPLAVLAAGNRSQALTNLGLTLLLYVPGLLHALAVVDRQHVQRRNEILMRIAARYYA
jgi:uncharacterized membrane protein YqaE (UPF0057 family)